MAKKKKHSKLKSFPIILVILALLFGGVYALGGFEGVVGLIRGEVDSESETDSLQNPPALPAEGEIKFHFVDVGQGDAILITTPEGNMLVDTSIKGAREELVAYLDSVGVKDFKYLVLTHPDADHIGNADYIIENYKIETILLSAEPSTSKTYERMLDAMEASDAEVITPEAGYVFELGGLRNTVLAPLEDYGDANEMSIVIRSVFGKTAVMLTGDAEHKSEEDIVVKYGADALKCDLLKMGHHGSSTSSTEAFLRLVDPTYAVISCGEGNTYGHPHGETIERLENMKIKYYRTDLLGTIVFITDGETIKPVE